MEQLDEAGRPWPAGASTHAELLGPRPDRALDRFEYDRVLKTARHAIDPPGRDLGRGLSLG